jgi:glutamate carboxypeptidase
MDRDRLSQAVTSAFEGEQIPFLRALVEQPSCTREPADVEAAAQIVDEMAARIGLVRTKLIDSEGRFADHRVYATPGTKSGDRAIALVGHVDTVFPRAMGFSGFSRDGEIARGPGVLDMKGGLSAILFALRALREIDPAIFDRLRARFVCVSDEEVGSPSSAPLFRALAPETDAALVFEAGRREDRIVTRRKGGAVYEIRVRGKAAHAGNRHAEGVSAIHGLALLVPALEALTDPDRGVTVNVGIFEGGTAKNTVPEHARVEIDGRFLKGEDGAWLDRAVRDLARDPFAKIAVPEKLRSLVFSSSGGVTRPPMEASEASQRLREAYEVHARAAGLGIGEAPLQGGGSDANLLSAHGVPCIDGLGPYGEHFHEREEWASLTSLARRTVALAAFLWDRGASHDEEDQERPEARAERT